MAKKFHPDVSSIPNARERFIQITEAYEVLVKLLTTEAALRKQRIHSYHETAQDIIDEWVKKEKERIRQRAHEFASMRYSNFKKSKTYKTTLLLIDAVHYGAFVLGILVMTGSVLGTWIQWLTDPRRIDFTYIFNSLLILLVGGVMTVYAIHQIRKTKQFTRK